MLIINDRDALRCSTFNLEVFAIVWLHGRSCVTILCCTPAHGLYGHAYDIRIDLTFSELVLSDNCIFIASYVFRRDITILRH
jgi:hypothetical protein